MKKVLVFIGIIIFLVVIVAGYFVGDTWGHLVAMVEDSEVEAQKLSDKIKRQEVKLQTDPSLRQDFELLNMKLVKLQLQNVLMAELVKQGLFDTLVMLASGRRKEGLRKMYFDGMLKIDVSECPEEFRKRFKALADEFKLPDSRKKDEKLHQLFDYLEEFEKAD
jgi:hypothetical protein